MFIEMEHPAELETPVSLQFRLPGEDSPIRIEGRVAWVSERKDDSPAGVGIEFQNLTPDTRQTINRIVRQLKSSGGS
jgi:Tfp pilus assembly protein PilZ